MERPDTAIVLYVMGVSGSGKSTIGKAIAEKLEWPFYDGDDFHPIENIDKMASGQPLNDEDRQGWLEARKGHFMPPALLLRAWSVLLRALQLLQ